MHILFVCTGNICRSPMAELLAKRYFDGSDITVSSAGTHGLPQHRIDVSAALIMENIGIDTQSFRSRRLNQHIAKKADLILCFEKQQRNDVVLTEPAMVQRCFLLTEFAQMCDYCSAQHTIPGHTLSEKLESVIHKSALVRPLLPEMGDIADPYGKDIEYFRVAADQTNREIRRIIANCS